MAHFISVKLIAMFNNHTAYFKINVMIQKF